LTLRCRPRLDRCKLTVLRSTHPHKLGLFVVVPAAVLTASTAARALTITQSIDPVTIAAGNSVACGNGSTHRENSYYRVFDLSTLLTTARVESVQIGVAHATGGPQPVQLKLHQLDGAFVVANLTQLGAVDASVPNLTNSLFDIPVEPPIAFAAAKPLVVEIFTPNGQPFGFGFFIGANAAGQTAPSYLRAADCMLLEPTDFANVAPGFPNLHIVMSLEVYGCGDGVTEVPETCDDGNVSSGDGCDANCTPTGCGNGLQTSAEACDDGNSVDGDGCSAACTIEGGSTGAGGSAGGAGGGGGGGEGGTGGAIGSGGGGSGVGGAGGTAMGTGGGGGNAVGTGGGGAAGAGGAAGEAGGGGVASGGGGGGGATGTGGRGATSAAATGSGANGGGSAGSGANAPAGDDPDSSGDDGGCSCHVLSARERPVLPAALVTSLLVLALRRRRRAR
jgi:cysteine-rich repeat protein